MQCILMVELSCTSRLVLTHLEACLLEFGSLQAGSLRAEQLHLLCQLSSLCLFPFPAHTHIEMAHFVSRRMHLT